MKVLNYEQVSRLAAARASDPRNEILRCHKKNRRLTEPKLSIVLLDWECRERYDTLDWLSEQNIPRDAYELIWIDLYDRVPNQAMQLADVVITLSQRGMYHKHAGYNIGVLAARGELVAICDSDAVFPADFATSVLRAFDQSPAAGYRPLVLMHHELRTSLTYPVGLSDAEELKDQKRWQWWPLNPNAGACMTVRREDAIRFGGFDEHKSFRGYLCGPYDLGWRLVNAGLPQEWHDLSTVLWHFAHPDPIGTNGLRPTLARLLENTHPHVDLHALTAVEAFSAGRMLPRQEHPEIHRLRMANRRIGTAFEEKYAFMTGSEGFSRRHVLLLRAAMTWNLLTSAVAARTVGAARRLVRLLLRERGWQVLRSWLGRGAESQQAGPPQLVGSVNAYNIIQFRERFYGIPQSLGPVDLYDDRDCDQPQILKCRTRNEVEAKIRKAG